MTADTATTATGLEDAPTSHPRLLAWVTSVAELAQPERVHWCDGSDAEWTALTDALVEAGTLVRLNEAKKPNSFWARTDPSDVARVEERTFICSVDEADAGPTNNWRDPDEMKAEMTELYRGSMRGRTMYVIPFCMGPVEAEHPMFGVEITDSAYVVASLRIASAIARDEGWLAEHMLIVKLTSPANAVHYIAAAFPSACGKTNLAMLEPTIPGWKVETLGDDIAWMRFGEDGRLYAMNPEYGLFGVAPGTGWKTNPNAMRTMARGNSIFTNVALTDDGDIWWEGMTAEPPAHLTDWKGRDWTPDSDEPSSHPNSRFCTPITQCPIIAPEYDDPRGVPISAILFGGRRATTVPLVTEARDWTHGVFMGATLSSETTAAAAGQVGVVRRDPMAMLPFMGYNAGDYFGHWIALGKEADAVKLPKIYYVNWFRRDDDGDFLWPGYGENGRVLKWVVERLEGIAAAAETPIGHVPALEGLDVDGLDLTREQIESCLRVDEEEWKAEVPRITQWFERFGDKLPTRLWAELDGLKSRLGLH